MSLAECDLEFCSLTLYDFVDEKIVFRYTSAFEAFEYKGELVLDLNIGESQDLRTLDVRTRKLTAFSVSEIPTLRLFNDFISYELGRGCLCD